MVAHAVRRSVGTLPKLRPSQTAEGWDEVADAYAELIDPDFGPYSEAALELVPVSEGDRVIDIACGPGALSLRAARHGASVLGVDLSPGQIAILEDRAAKEGLTQLQAQVMDGQSLALEDATFDAGFSMFGIMLFPDRSRGFEELHRVVRPGGRVAISAWADPSEIEWFSLFKEAVETAVPAFDPPPPPFIDLTDPSRFEQELVDAGFESVEVHRIDAYTVSQGSAASWRKLAEANPVLPALFEALGEDAVADIEATFLELYEERYPSGPVELASPAYIAVGTRGPEP